MDHYDIGRILGKGGFASVHAARDRRSGKRVAIKLANVSSSPSLMNANIEAGGMSIRDMLSREIRVHSFVSTFQHPNIVTMIDSFVLSDHMMAVVMEDCRRGSLQSCFKRVQSFKQQLQWQENKHSNDNDLFLPEIETQHVIYQILNGLAFLHQQGVVHRDVKASNILLCPNHESSIFQSKSIASSTIHSKESNHKHPNIHPSNKHDGNFHNGMGFSLLNCTIKIADFGLAVQMSQDDDWDEGQHTLCGTPSCLAPEVALSTPKPKQTSHSSQVFKNQHNQNYYIPNRNVIDGEGQDVRGHGQPVDLWSSGCILYAMLVGRYPFSSHNNNDIDQQEQDYNLKGLAIAESKHWKVKQTITRVLKGEWHLPSSIESQISDGVKSLLSKLLSLNPKDRGTATAIISSHLFWKNLHPPSLIDARDQVNDPFTQKHQHTSKPILSRTRTKSTVKNEAIHLETNRIHIIRTATNPNPCFDVSAMVSSIETNNLPSTQNFRSNGSRYPLTATMPGTNTNAFKPTHDIYQDSNVSSLVNTHAPLHLEAQESNTVGRPIMHKNYFNINTSTSSYNSNLPYPSPCFNTTKSPSLPNTPRIRCAEFVDRLENLHRLSPMKHEWKQLSKSKHSNKMQNVRYCKVFLLPEDNGIVVQREDNDKNGIWMHVAGDGLQVCMCEMSPLYSSTSKKIEKSKTDPENIMEEAFARAPDEVKSKIKYFPPSLSKLPFNTLPNSRRNYARSTSIFYKPLSSLSHPRNKSFKYLYKDIVKIVNSIKQCTPKITLYLHAPSPTYGDGKSDLHHSSTSSLELVGGLVAKSMLMENSPLPDVVTNFVDGISIRYQLSNGKASLTKFDSEESKSLNIDLDLNVNIHKSYHTNAVSHLGDFPNQNLSANDTMNRKEISNSLHKYAKHISMAQTTIEECLFVENALDNEQYCQKQRGHHHSWRDSIEENSRFKDVFPVTKTIIVVGTSKNEWIHIMKPQVIPEKGPICKDLVENNASPTKVDVPRLHEYLLDDESDTISLMSVKNDVHIPISESKSFDLADFVDLPHQEEASKCCKLPNVGAGVRLKCGSLYAKLMDDPNVILMLDAKGEKMHCWDLWKRENVDVLRDRPDSVYDVHQRVKGSMKKEIKEKIVHISNILRHIASC